MRGIKSALKPYFSAIGDFLKLAAIGQKGTTPKKRKDVIRASEGKWWLLDKGNLYLEQRFFTERRLKDGREIRRSVLSMHGLRLRPILARPLCLFGRGAYGKTLFLSAGLMQEKHLSRARQIICEHDFGGRSQWMSPTKAIDLEGLKFDLELWYWNKAAGKSPQEIWDTLEPKTADRLSNSKIRSRIERVDRVLAMIRKVGPYWDGSAPRSGIKDFHEWFFDGWRQWQQAQRPPA